MTKEQVNNFEKIEVQIQSLHEEITNLSKKSQNDVLNKFKLKFVNATINEANIILGDDYKPFSNFELFDEIDLPSNSDVTLILSQYLNCLEKLRSDNIYEEYGDWFWLISGKKSSTETRPPLKLKRK